MEERLRILMVAFLFSPIVGGAETRAEKQARQLQAQGHQVTVITLRHEKHWKKVEDLAGLPVIRVGGTYRRSGMLRIGRIGHLPIDILVFLQLWRLRNQYDVIHSLQMSPLAGVAALIGKLTHKPVVVSIPSTGPGKQQHAADATMMVDTLAGKGIDTSFLQVPFEDIVVGDISHMSRTALGGGLIINYLKKSDVFYQLLSSRSLGYLTSRGFRAEKMFTIPNGVDIDRFRPDPARRPDPASPERAILCVARLQFPKGIDVLLHAWSRMMHAPAAWRENLRPKLLIAGTGELGEKLERLAELLEIQDSIEFLGLRKDVIPLLQQSWGFVLPSRWEGMPNALLEAMSCGVPCIATRVSGSEDIIENGVNGLMVEPEQPAALAQALRLLIEDTELAQRLAAAGRATVERDYQLSRITERFVEFYRRALGKDEQIKPLVLNGVREN